MVIFRPIVTKVCKMMYSEIVIVEKVFLFALSICIFRYGVKIDHTF